METKMVRDTIILKAIDDAIEAAQDTTHRKHMGASIIGDKCARKLWLGFRWATPVKHKARLLRLFERGKLEETRFVKWLEDTGVTVWQIDPETKKQYRFTGYKGHFGGEVDGIAKGIIDSPYVVEFKTHNEKSFSNLCDDGVALSKTNHYVQMQMYMGAFNVPKALYVAINKNTDEIYTEIITFEPACYKNFCDRAAAIIDATEPPPRISNHPTWYECKWCEHHPVCHKGEAPQRNCRTCAHSTPIENGQWHCEQDRTKSFPIIEESVIVTGCGKYIQHPME